MKKIMITISALALTVIMAGCEPKTVNVDTTNDTGKAVVALDYRDFERAAAVMIESLSKSTQLNKPDGSRYVMAVSRIINDTMQRIDTDQLTAKIEEELLNSGRVVLTAAVRGTANRDGSSGADQMVMDVRELRNNDEFNSDTTMAKGQLIAPELSLSGKILQRNIGYDKKTQQIEYYFQLKVADLASGLVIWQKEEVIAKRASNKSAAW